MALWIVFILIQAAAPWIAAATVAAVLSYELAEKESRSTFAGLAVFLVSVCALASMLLPELRAIQLDRLRFHEASTFCSDAPVKVLRPLPAGPVKFGVYDSYLGPGDYKTLDFALRSRQTQAGSVLQRATFVQLQRGAPVPDDVYPVLRHLANSSVSLSMIDPQTGEIIAYSNYIHGQESATKSRYVGCDREANSSSGKLEVEELFALLSAVVMPAAVSAAPPAESVKVPPRKFDIEVTRVNDVREDCSKGLTMAPSLNAYSDYRYLRSGDDLVILVLDRAAWNETLRRKDELAQANLAPVLWQHFHPVVTCKSYFSENSKAGPIFHSGGYEEPIARVRALGKETYYPFDYGPHRKVECKDTIVTGTVRPAWHYVLKREGRDLVIAAFQELHGESTKVTPLVTCEGYFDVAPGAAPDVRLGTGGSTREIHHPAALVLELRDGQHLGPRGTVVSLRMSEPVQASSAPKRNKRAPAPAPPAPKSAKEPARGPWPAKPKALDG